MIITRSAKLFVDSHAPTYATIDDSVLTIHFEEVYQGRVSWAHESVPIVNDRVSLKEIRNILGY